VLQLAGLLSIAYVAFFLYCLLDVVRSESSAVRNLPKLTWLLLVVFVPLVGGTVWILAGRPLRPATTSGGTRARSRISRDHPSVRDRSQPPKGPDDDPAFLRRLDEQLRRDQVQDEDD
jgi:H+/Cl- antiporter ClcA